MFDSDEIKPDPTETKTTPVCHRATAALSGSHLRGK